MNEVLDIFNDDSLLIYPWAEWLKDHLHPHVIIKKGKVIDDDETGIVKSYKIKTQIIPFDDSGTELLVRIQAYFFILGEPLYRYFIRKDVTVDVYSSR